MWRSAFKILRTDSRLTPSSWLRRRTDLLGLWATESLTAATLCGVPDDFGRPKYDCLLVSLRLRLCTVPWVLNLLTHLLITEWTGISRHPNNCLNCNWAAWIDFCWKYASTINVFCSVVHGISKVKSGRLLEH